MLFAPCFALSGHAVTDLLTDVLTLDKLEEGCVELRVHATCLECLSVAACDLFVPLARSKGLGFSRGVRSIDGVQSVQLTVADPELKTDHSTDVSVVERSAGPFDSTWHSSSGTWPSPNACLHGRRAAAFIDAERISQVLRAMLSTAFTLSKSGSVELELNSLGEELVANVTMSNMHTRLDQLLPDQLFRPYAQLEAQGRDTSSAGLGLAISKRLARLHGGDLTYDSHGGASGAFTLSLPMSTVTSRSPARSESALSDLEFPVSHSTAADKATRTLHLSSSQSSAPLVLVPPLAPTSAPRIDRVSQAGGAKTVLVVDDVLLNAKLLCRLLESRGFRTVFVQDGAAALREVTVDLTRFDAVIMDRNMPNMDGLQATRAVRAAGYTGTVIGLTGDVSMESETEFRSAGADVVMSKPLDVRKLEMLLG